MKGSIRAINPHAGRLRREMTDAERTLWFELRDRRLQGFKFKRQWTLGPSVADFCCWEKRLVIEVDGGQHDLGKDAARTAWLEREGYRVIRFWNNDVLTNLEGVLATIVTALTMHPHPSRLSVNIAPRCSGHAGGMTDRNPPQAGEGA